MALLTGIFFSGRGPQLAHRPRQKKIPTHPLISHDQDGGVVLTAACRSKALFGCRSVVVCLHCKSIDKQSIERSHHQFGLWTFGKAFIVSSSALASLHFSSESSIGSICINKLNWSTDARIACGISVRLFYSDMSEST
jgi:hypothetical protein